MPSAKIAPRENLFQIETTLEQLYESLEAAEYEGDSPAVEAINREIAAYLTKEAAKVDSYAGLIHRLENEADLCEAEAERLETRAKARRKQVDRLKANALEAMQRFDVAELKTPTNTLRRQANGGSAPLEIVDALVDTQYRTYVLAMSYEMWTDLLLAVPQSLRDRLQDRVASDPNKTAIRKMLERGHDVPGAKLLPRGEHLRIL